MDRQRQVDRAKQWNNHVRAVVRSGRNRRRGTLITAVVCALLLSGAGFMTQRAYVHWEQLDRARKIRVIAVQEAVRQTALRQDAQPNRSSGAAPQPGPAKGEEQPAQQEAAVPVQPPESVPSHAAQPESVKGETQAPPRPHRILMEAAQPEEAVPSYTTQPETETPVEEAKPPARDAASGYAALYPELYAVPAQRETLAPDYTVYLTFDDGPSARTAEVLDILQANGIKATFFVTGQTSELAQAMMRRIVAEGHTIGIHTYTHNYREIYASVEAYLADFDRIYNWVYQVTGVYPQIFRFPGGTINGFNGGLYRALVDEMDRRGFVHYDWNAMCGDADGKVHTPEELAQNSLAVLGAKRAIILMHDNAIRATTVACLPAVIAGYRNAGYTFAPLTPEVKAITFD